MPRHVLVREDERGVFIQIGGIKARPGAITGYSHAYRMEQAGLKAGEHVLARHVPETELVEIRLPDGARLRWADEALHLLEAQRAPGDGGRMSREEILATTGSRVETLRRWGTPAAEPGTSSAPEEDEDSPAP